MAKASLLTKKTLVDKKRKASNNMKAAATANESKEVAAAVLAVDNRIAFDRKNKIKGKTGFNHVIVLDEEEDSETECNEDLVTNGSKRPNIRSAANPVVAKVPIPVVSSSVMSNVQQIPPIMPPIMQQGSSTQLGMSNMFGTSNHLEGGVRNVSSFEHNLRLMQTVQMMQVRHQQNVIVERQSARARLLNVQFQHENNLDLERQESHDLLGMVQTNFDNAMLLNIFNNRL